MIRKEVVIVLNTGSVVLLLPPFEEEDQAIHRLELLEAVLVHSVELFYLNVLDTHLLNEFGEDA